MRQKQPAITSQMLRTDGRGGVLLHAASVQLELFSTLCTYKARALHQYRRVGLAAPQRQLTIEPRTWAEL
jgi:hypothetical protein